MPLFFFDVQDGASLPDDTGVECRSLIEARFAAAQLACDLLHDAPMRFWNRADCAIDVRDAAGSRLLSLEITLRERVPDSQDAQAA